MNLSLKKKKMNYNDLICFCNYKYLNLKKIIEIFYKNINLIFKILFEVLIYKKICVWCYNGGFVIVYKELFIYNMLWY